MPSPDPRRLLWLPAALTAAALTVGGGSPAHAAPSPKPSLPRPQVTVSRYDALGGPKMAAHGVVKDARATTPPAVRNVSWLIADLDSGEVLAAKAPHARLRPASTLKTLTAVTLIPQISPKSSHRITDADAQAEGTRVGLVPGARYTGDELFNALLLSSGNDAAYALARVGGGRDTVLSEMNAQARRLGAWDTHAADPAGLDAPAQYSSAYDLALIGREAMKNTRFRTYVARKNATLPGVKRGTKRTRFEISNHNAVLYNYPGAIGVKNGYTTKANHTLISAVRRNGRTLIITQMYGLQGGWRPTAALYDWAFANLDRLSPVGHLVSPAEAQRIAASRTTSRERSRTTEPTPRATAQPTASAAPVATPATQPRRATLPLWGWAGAALGTLAVFSLLRRRRPTAARHGRSARHGRHR